MRIGTVVGPFNRGAATLGNGQRTTKAGTGAGTFVASSATVAKAQEGAWTTTAATATTGQATAATIWSPRGLLGRRRGRKAKGQPATSDITHTSIKIRRSLTSGSNARNYIISLSYGYFQQ